VVIAEALGGDEPGFAKLMNAKARTLGMMHTVYRNASGLPDDQQITTARDQAILGRAVHDRFPTYYHYFATRTFDFRGKSMRNHNHLLGSVDGVDGIKTGYIRDSGFNIVTSVRRANRHIVAVVFGGRSAEARDARVRSLIANNINIAAVKRTTPPVVEGWQIAQARKDNSHSKASSNSKESDSKDEDRTGSAPVRVASVASTSVAADAPAPGSTEPIKPLSVKTVTVHPGTMHTASLSSPLPSDSRKLMPAPAVANAAIVTTVTTVKSEPLPPAPPPLEAKPASVSTVPAKVASTSNSAPLVAPVATPAAKPRGPWIIQVGAFDDEKEAKLRLEEAQSKAKNLLDRADPFTEKVNKGDKTMFRSRFAGFEKVGAEAACKHLKRSEIPCMVLKN
jgi:D-alanyl-D-alanine carboxypeptidase